MDEGAAGAGGEKEKATRGRRKGACRSRERGEEVKENKGGGGRREGGRETEGSEMGEVGHRSISALPMTAGGKEQRRLQNNKCARLICSCNKGGGRGGYSLVSWTRATKPISGSCGVTCMEGGGGAGGPPGTGAGGGRSVSGRQIVCQRGESCRGHLLQ